MSLQVAIAAGGPAGFELAADLLKRNIPAMVYPHREHRGHTDKVVEQEYLQAAGAQLDGGYDLPISSDIAKLVAFSNRIVFLVPSTAQETICGE